MVNRSGVVAVVQARGGSKGIPGKNVKALAGIPLIAYSIAAGLQSKLMDRVIISTDSDEIAEVAQQWGAEVPFMRPAEYATDTSMDIDLFKHALRWFAENEDYHPEIVVQLRPTTPLRPPNCVDDAVKRLMQNSDATAVRGVVPSGQNPYKMWRLEDENQPMRPLLDTEFDEPYNMPRQKLPPTYWQTGHIDAIRAEVILEQDSMSGQSMYPLLIDSRYTIDIDNLQDWSKAEWMIARLDIPYVRPANPPHDPIADAMQNVTLLILDFDGVLTDNRVWVNQEGVEMIAADRGDGMGIELVRQHGVEVRVLSREENPVVAARCRKLKIQYQHGIKDKRSALQSIFDREGLTPDDVIYVGNDVNDLAPMSMVGCAVAVADAYPSVLAQADFVLSKNGGYGAVRELCDLIIKHKTSS